MGVCVLCFVCNRNALVNFASVPSTNVFHSIASPALYGTVQSTWVRGQCVYDLLDIQSVVLNVGQALCHK